MKYITTVNDVEFEVDIRPDGRIFVNGEEREVDFLPSADPALFSLIMDRTSHEVLVEERDEVYEVIMLGRLFTASVLDERAQLLSKSRGGSEVDTGEISIRAPMPGLVVEIPVSEGEAVTKGQTVVILESMKMQNELKSPRDGTVQRINTAAGQGVEQNALLITIV